jgi:purine-binding chemotaxis protein CheW
VSETQIVVCALKNESYGLDISRVFEIIRLQPVTAVPQAPRYVDGVINLRGRLIPIVDLSVRFGMPRSTPTRDSRIVVTGTCDTRVGLVVDGVSEVLLVSDDAVEPTPAAVTNTADAASLKGIARVGDHLVILLELDALLDEAGCGANELAGKRVELAA